MHSTPPSPAACVLQAAACNTQHHHLTQVSACHKGSKIGAIMKRKLGIHSMHPYHDSTLIKVMMANGQQLQPMHALFLHSSSCMHWVYLSLSSPSPLLVALGTSEGRWTAAHVHTHHIQVWTQTQHLYPPPQIIYGQCMTIEKESNQDTSEYWDGSSSKLQKNATLFPHAPVPFMQGGCSPVPCSAGVGGLKKLCSFDLFPCIYAMHRQDYYLYGHWTWRQFNYNISSTPFPC